MRGIHLHSSFATRRTRSFFNNNSQKHRPPTGSVAAAALPSACSFTAPERGTASRQPRAAARHLLLCGLRFVLYLRLCTCMHCTQLSVLVPSTVFASSRDVHSSVSTRTNVIIAILAKITSKLRNICEMHMQTSKMSAHIHRAHSTALGRATISISARTAEGDGSVLSPARRERADCVHRYE